MKKHSEVFGNSKGLEEKYSQNQLLALLHNAFLIEKEYISANQYEENIENIKKHEYLSAFNHYGEEAIISCKKERPESCLTFDLNCSENGAWVNKNLRKNK